MTFRSILRLDFNSKASDLRRQVVRYALALGVSLLFWSASRSISVEQHGTQASSAPPENIARQFNGLRDHVSNSQGAVDIVSNQLQSKSTQRSPAKISRLRRGFADLPLQFERNEGQAAPDVRFVSHGASSAMLLRDAGLSLRFTSRGRQCAARDDEKESDRALETTHDFAGSPFPSHTESLSMSFLNANRSGSITGEEELAGKANYLVGSDRSKWRTGISTYKKVVRRNLYPGIDLVYYGRQRQLEYDLIVAPGADIEVVTLQFDGADDLHLDSNGNLIIATACGEVVKDLPAVYQQIGERRVTVACRYALKGGNRVGFDVGSYDHNHSLTVDPSLNYSTVISGNGADVVRGIAVDASGNAYLTGSTTSTDFPTLGPVQQRYGGATDAFVAKLNAAGNALVYSTYLGGRSTDQANGIGVDSAGNAYLTGSTQSTDFPTANAFQPASRGGFLEGFIAKLNPSGSALVYSSYIGGTDQEIPSGIAVDPTGNAYITGYTQSADFPITGGAFQTTLGGGIGGVTCFTNRPCPDAFVTKVNAGGTLAYSTFLGGNRVEDYISSSDTAGAIAVDAAGNAYVTGATNSPNFPTRNAMQGTCTGCAQFSNFEAFVTKLNPTGSALVYSTYLGGSGGDIGYGIAIDAAGNAYVTGVTGSDDFPVLNAVQRTFSGGNSDAFLVKLDSAGSKLYSTFLGGGGDETGRGIAADSTGAVYVTGETDSPNFPLASATQETGGGGFFKSTDGGLTWSVSNSGLLSGTVNSVQVDPGNTTTIFAGTPAGVFKSSNAAATWTATAFTRRVNALQLDPTNPAVLYAGFFGGVSKTTDGGISWAEPGTGLSASVHSIAIDPKSPANIYAGTLSGGIFKSTNGGNSWNAANTGLPNTAWINVIGAHPTAGNTIFAGVRFPNRGFFRSTDGGATWTSSKTGLPDQAVLGIAFSAQNSSTMFVVTENSSISVVGGVFKSTDGGANWSPLIRTQFDVVSIAADPTGAANLYVGTGAASGSGYGVYKSSDSGVNWTNTGIFRTTVQALAVDPKNPATIYAGALGGSDAFISVLNDSGTALRFSTYLGGTGFDAATAAALGKPGELYAAGFTTSKDFLKVTRSKGSEDDYLRFETISALIRDTPNIFIISHPSLAPPSKTEFIKSVSSTDAVVGQTLTYTLTVKVAETETPFKPEITDEIPLNMVIVDVFVGCSVNHIDNIVSCPLSVLSPGETRSVRITVIPQTPGPATNRAKFRYEIERSVGLDVITLTSEVSTTVRANPRRRP
ncbi:MAG TPA: SBBP repeat-containing protein [Acidobacteriota bacterium]|nr:SBBP repeat-containing protein [Acidobacteriota bacterium]